MKKVTSERNEVATQTTPRMPRIQRESIRVLTEERLADAKGGAFINVQGGCCGSAYISSGSRF
ncbi:hypothetical protein L6R50_06175 [Myxococcota bacterium]|nr:hypothetical protein [Myxococcota bacterium]